MIVFQNHRSLNASLNTLQFLILSVTWLRSTRSKSILVMAIGKITYRWLNIHYCAEHNPKIHDNCFTTNHTHTLCIYILSVLRDSSQNSLSLINSEVEVQASLTHIPFSLN